MSQAGHLESDPKGKCIPRKHALDVRPHNRWHTQVHRLNSKIPQESHVCTPRWRGEGSEAKEGREVAKNGAKGKKGLKATHRLASASAKRA